MTKPITISLTDTEEPHLEAIARRDSVSIESLASDLVRRGIEHQAWLEAIVEEGRDDIRQGRVYSQEEVQRISEERRKELLAKPRG
jgi:predicted transcriptional regulator